jgi:hypothetical protein
MDLSIHLIQLHTILKHVLFPIDQERLILDLSSSGFTPAQPGSMILNRLIIQPGDLAVKNNTAVTVNPQSKMISIAGLTPEEVYKTWKEVEEILKKQDVVLSSSGRLFELKIEGRIKTGKNPVKSIQKTINNDALTQKIDRIIEGKPSSISTLRFIPKDAEANDEDYYDIRVEPLLIKPKKEYFVRILYRNKILGKSEKLLLNANSKLEEIINIIES